MQFAQVNNVQAYSTKHDQLLACATVADAQPETGHMPCSAPWLTVKTKHNEATLTMVTSVTRKTSTYLSLKNMTKVTTTV